MLNQSLRTMLKRLFPAGARLYRETRSRLWRRRFGPGNVAVFDEIIRDGKKWPSDESRSGEGSNLAQTEIIRREIPALLRRVSAKSMLDAPCGDWHWMRHVALNEIDYVGADVVEPLIARNRRLYGTGSRRFEVLDITKDALPEVDVIFCRDCLVHFSYELIFAALANLRSSGAKYLLTTTFTDRAKNLDIVTGDWRPLNLQAAPFSFPPPVAVINEGCTQDFGVYRDKSLALWRFDSLPD